MIKSNLPPSIVDTDKTMEYKTEFDKFADEYQDLHKSNIKISGEEPDFFAEYKIKDISSLFINAESSEIKIMDFGTGVGNSIPYFNQYFPKAKIIAADVSNKSLSVARERFADLARFLLLEREPIPIPDSSLDLIFAACVFHHIPANRHVPLLREWHRLLKPQGIAVVFEHNPWNPFTTHAVNTCPFDENAKLISAPIFRRRFLQAGFGATDLRYRLFIPGAIRWLRPIERYLNWCPLGAQYLIVGRKQGITV